MTPPTPVLAPPNGSIADGWLCVSALRATVVPSTKVTMPALPTNADRTNGAADSIRCVAKPVEEPGSPFAGRGRDLGPERLVGAVLAPRLGEGLQLDVGRVAIGGAEVVADHPQLGRVERQCALPADRLQPVVVEVAQLDHGRRGARLGAGVQVRVGEAGAPLLDHRVGDEAPQ